MSARIKVTVYYRKKVQTQHPSDQSYLVRDSKEVYLCTVYVNTPYHQDYPLKNVLKDVDKKLVEKYHSKYSIKNIRFHSDQPKQIGYLSNDTRRGPITKFSQNDLIMYGFRVIMNMAYHHQIDHNEISCEYMKINNSLNPQLCPIYKKMKNQYEFNTENLNHLYQFNHFNNNFDNKPVCKYKDTCNAYKRLINNGERIDDKCHIEIYRHPPRQRQIKLAKHFHSFICHDTYDGNNNAKLYKPTMNDKIKYKFNKKDGYLNALIEEVVGNGFENDLCTNNDDDDDDDIKMDIDNQKYGLLKIVDKKLEHPRHLAMMSPLNRSEMLALILYTGCDCNYDLCGKQRSGDFKTWQWFDYCLWNAISNLDCFEHGSYPLFSGLANISLKNKSISGCLKTYTSTSWQKKVATNFLGNTGMLIEFNAGYRASSSLFSRGFSIMCDVSWISKFPDECEILIARNVGNYGTNAFDMQVSDQKNIQIVTASSGFYHN